MYKLYNFSILIYKLLIDLAANFNQKAKLFKDGRINIFHKIEKKINPKDHPIWFHFASLGEFEQGRPVLEKLKSIHPEKKIIITFFSPSGYEIRKNYPLADAIFYLPLDTPTNAKLFITLVNPSMAIFTKYELWPNYFDHLQKKKIPLFLISAIFRPNQIFFKWYGSFYREILHHVNHFFVQNEQSLQLLNQIGLNNTTISGDTRFDRVYENAQHPTTLSNIEKFCNNQPVLVAGSTWPDDEKLLADLANTYPGWKIIIAPHEVHEAHISAITTLFPDSFKYSDLNENSLTDYRTKQTLIINNIGMLSSLYQYGKIAYIGGGFGAGIHNTLEAVAFGLPVIFGPNYSKFQEAKDLISKNLAKSINNNEELIGAFEFYQRNNLNKEATTYIYQNKGATDKIIDYINLKS